MKIITLELFKKIYPKAKSPELIHAAFAKYFKTYSINTSNRRAGFLAQCGHESGGFVFDKENLNYS